MLGIPRGIYYVTEEPLLRRFGVHADYLVEATIATSYTDLLAVVSILDASVSWCRSLPSGGFPLSYNLTCSAQTPRYSVFSICCIERPLWDCVASVVGARYPSFLICFLNPLVFRPEVDEGWTPHPIEPSAMKPFNCPPSGCYPPVTATWELTNQWAGRSTLVYSSRSQPPQWSQDGWNNVMLHTGVPPHALDEFYRLGRPDHRTICGMDKSRSRSRGRDRVEHPNRNKSRSRSRGRNYDIDRIREGEYKGHIPNKKDFTVKHVEKKSSEKELKSILKNKDNRIFFDSVKGPYYGLNTFSEHPVLYEGFKFPTVEHLLFYFKVCLCPGLHVMA